MLTAQPVTSPLMLATCLNRRCCCVATSSQHLPARTWTNGCRV
jgi:hypothetical protein